MNPSTLAKHQWRKQERSLYLPKERPELIDVPYQVYLTLKGEGEPGDSAFAEAVKALYSISYALKMGLKRASVPPKDYVDYTVYPLEGLWGRTMDTHMCSAGCQTQVGYVYELMIRQPEFITKRLFMSTLTDLVQRNGNAFLSKLGFQIIKDGKSVQMMHVGPFETEKATLERMEIFAVEHQLKRTSEIHREIYLTDVTKTKKEHLKTVLRFAVEEAH